MAFSNPIVTAGVAGLGELYRDRAVTPLEACEVYLSRIEGLDGALGAIADHDGEGARRAAHSSAERWREGRPLSGLDGIPLLIDAAIAVEGLDGVAGRAPIDAGLVARLRQAGAVILGLGVADGDVARRGAHNPWSFETPCGGAPAAVAAGFCAAAVSLEAVGDLGRGAAACGLWAHRPTPGLVSSEGVAGGGWTFDQPAVLARSALDAARVFGGLCATEPDLAAEIAEPATPESLAGAPLALLGWGGALQPGAARMMSLARGAGLEIETIELEGLDLDGLAAAARFVRACEAMASVPDAELERRRAQEPAPFTRSARDLARAYRTLADAAERIREALSPYAALLSPAAGGAASILAALTGIPATGFPSGLDAAGRPVGACVAGWDDETTQGLARFLAAASDAPPDYRG